MSQDIIAQAINDFNARYRKPGDVFLSWCHVHGPDTRFIFNPGKQQHPMMCLLCHPELDPEKKESEA